MEPGKRPDGALYPTKGGCMHGNRAPALDLPLPTAAIIAFFAAYKDTKLGNLYILAWYMVASYPGRERGRERGEGWSGGRE